MEERRVGRVRESMRVYCEVERKVLPIVSKCLDGMTKAAESIEPKMVGLILIGLTFIGLILLEILKLNG